jgi:DNA-binding XRE family transcriptional regulator
MTDRADDILHHKKKAPLMNRDEHRSAAKRNAGRVVAGGTFAGHSAHPLRQWRWRHGITLCDMAAYVEASAATISRLERGLQAPRVHLVARLVEAINNAVTAADFHDYQLLPRSALTTSAARRMPKASGRPDSSR